MAKLMPLKACSSNSALGLFACRPGWPAYKPRSVCPLSWSFFLTVHSSSVSTRKARLSNSTRPWMRLSYCKYIGVRPSG
jgi:hypothetical protein